MKTDKRQEPKPAKFRFDHIGPVAEAELELGDLTIISGRNNTGKTYLAYTLYGFLKTWRHWPEPEIPASKQAAGGLEGTNRYPIFDRIIGSIAEGRDGQIEVEREMLARERERIMESLTRSFSEDALAGVFSSHPDTFANASLKVFLDDEFPQYESSMRIKTHRDDVLSGDLSLKYDGKHITVADLMMQKGRKRSSEVRRDLWRLYLRFLFPELVATDPFVLTSERFGISLFYKELDFTKNRLVDLLQKMGDRDSRDPYLPFALMDGAVSRYALPIKDNIDYTRSIPDFVRRKSEFHEEKIFKNIETMMKGYYRNTGDNIEFRATARGARRFKVPQHLASSSARGLSDLYFFLRHVARKDHLLIIDEPEGHLDTANQVLLARMVARLVRNGLKILVTTHSDYFVKEINNLVMLNGLLEGKEGVVTSLGYENDDGIAPSRIRAYVAQENGLDKCVVDKFGVDMPVFDRTIDQINRVANELASHLAEDAED